MNITSNFQFPLTFNLIIAVFTIKATNKYSGIILTLLKIQVMPGPFKSQTDREGIVIRDRYYLCLGLALFLIVSP